jgi:hypothetical protein
MSGGREITLENTRCSGNYENQEDTNMQAIQTKFLGATNHRGSRVKAIAAAGSVTLSWDYAKTTEDNHRAAANALMEKLDWNWGPVTMSTGTLKDGTFVHVFQYAGRNYC